MVPMRDGVRLAFDVYRPGRDGAFAEGRFQTIMVHTAYDKATKRYIEIADYFVPRGYAVVLVDMRDRYRSEGSGTYFHSATPHTGPDGYDIVEWIAAQPDSAAIWDGIYHQVVQPTVALIEAGETQAAFELYGSAIRQLQAAFLSETVGSR